jgi:YidC/Oxa1 family membrane protein insertase
MERRVVIFIVISILIFALWQHFIISPKLEQQRQEQAKRALLESKKVKKEPQKVPTQGELSTPKQGENIDDKMDIDILPTQQNLPEKVIDIDAPLYHAEFSTKGAVLTSFRLKKHWDIPQNIDELNSKLQIEKDMDKVIKTNLRTIYSSSQVSGDYIALNNLIKKIEEAGPEKFPESSDFRESLRNFISNAAGKTNKQIITELGQIKNFLACKLILEDITERKERVKKILEGSKQNNGTDKKHMDELEIESGVEMVSPISRSINRYPFEMNDDSGKYDFRYLNFATDSKDSITIDGKNPSCKITFVSYLGKEKELVIKKVFTLYSDNYVLDMDISIKNNSVRGIQLGSLSYEWGQGITFMSGGESKKYTHEGLLTNQNGGIKKDVIGIFNANWNGIEDSFFTVTMFSEGKPLMCNNHSGLGIPSIAVLEEGRIYNPAESSTLKIKCYMGPKQIQYLRKPGVGLEKMVDYGWFTFLALPLLEAMKFLFKYIPNYGFVIIIITIIIRILFYPLNAKSMKSMKKMQELQPKIKELRDKYKSDRQKMNEELMALYKRYNVNPMGGCLPMLVQIPILFAFFRLLPITVEFRHQPFIFWIKDLTAKDPYYVTPILMGLSMIIQQKMSPTSVDPKQAQIMMFMPIFFTFLFLNFSSGLVLYWFVSNLLAIGQQHLMNRETQPDIKKSKKGNMK